MIGAARIDQPRDFRMLSPARRRSTAALSVCARTRTASVSSPFSSTQALNGDIDGPVWRMKLCRCSAMKASDAEDHAAEAAALAVDMLGRGIHHDVGAERQRALPDRGREHVVDDQPGAGLMRDLGDGADVEHVERRIGRAFQEAAFGIRPHRLAPLVEIEAVDQGRFDAVARQQIFDHVAARSEHRLRRHHVIAGFQRRQHRGRHRGHAGRGRAAGFGAFEFDHAALEHRDRRIGIARIDDSRGLRP